VKVILCSVMRTGVTTNYVWIGVITNDIISILLLSCIIPIFQNFVVGEVVVRRMKIRWKVQIDIDEDVVKYWIERR